MHFGEQSEQFHYSSILHMFIIIMMVFCSYHSLIQYSAFIQLCELASLANIIIRATKISIIHFVTDGRS